jgi:large conductance mechanosensitive channel
VVTWRFWRAGSGPGVLRGFQDFLLRGNVMKLAVAVVIGEAFTQVVTSFTDSIVKPVIAVAGSTNVQGFGLYLNPAKPATFLNLSTAINAVITFFITAAVVYFVFVLPLQKIQERRSKGRTTTETTELELLAEIRDLLRDSRGLPPLDHAVIPALTEEDGAEHGAQRGMGN